MRKVNVILRADDILPSTDNDIYVAETGRREAPFTFTTELYMATAYSPFDVIGYGRAIQWAKEAKAESGLFLREHGRPSLEAAPE